MKAFSWDPASCITETNSPTSKPTTLSPTSQLEVFQTTGFALPEISLRLINIQSVELSNIQTSKIQDIIRNIAEDEVDILNVNIMSVDVVNTEYSQERTLETDDKKNLMRSGVYSKRILASALTLLIEIRVSETALLPHELYSTILGAVQLRKYDIDEVFRDVFGSKYNNVILEVDDHRTTLAPSPAHTSDSVTNVVPVRNNMGEKDVTNVISSIGAETNKTLTLVLVILFGLFFAFISFGLIAWQRKRDSRSDKAFNTRSQYSKKRKRKPKRKSKRNHNVSEPTLKISNNAYVDEEQNKMEERLMVGFAPNQENTNPQIEFTSKEDEDKGYDGGKSSFLESQGNFSKSSALNSATELRTGVDPEESSVGDNVLGLLYYAGASSAEEEEDTGTARNIARMKRRSSNASSRQTRTSAKTRRSSTSSRSRKSKRKDDILKEVEEDNDYGYHREENFNDLHFQNDEPSLNGSFPVRSLHSQLPYSSCSVSTVTNDEELMTFNRWRSASHQPRSPAKTRISSASSRSRNSKRKDNFLKKVEEDNDYDFHREENFNDFHVQIDEPSLNGSFPVPYSSRSISTASDDEELMTFNRRASIGTAITEDAQSLDVEDLFT